MRKPKPKRTRLPDLYSEDDGWDGGEAIDARSAELVAEVRAYMAGCRGRFPDQTDRDFYEGWAIQKIAGLQILVELLNERLGMLGGEFERRTRGMG